MVSFWRQQTGTGAYLLAALFALAAAVLHLAIASWVGPRLQYLVFLPAIAAAAMLAGRGPAILLLVVGAFNALVVVPLFAEPKFAFPAGLALAAYLVVGLMLVLFGGR